MEEKPGSTNPPQLQKPLFQSFLSMTLLGMQLVTMEVYLKLLMVDTIGSVCPPGPIIV